MLLMFTLNNYNVNFKATESVNCKLFFGKYKYPKIKSVDRKSLK